MVKSDQNSEAEKRGGTIMEPPVRRGVSRPAAIPWMWKSGITSKDLSSLVRLYVDLMLFVVFRKFRCVKGTAFGLPVVPEVSVAY